MPLWGSHTSKSIMILTIFVCLFVCLFYFISSLCFFITFAANLKLANLYHLKKIEDNVTLQMTKVSGGVGSDYYYCTTTFN